MKKIFLILSLLTIGVINSANAAPITPKFPAYPLYTPTADNLDADASAWFNTNYGITFDHLYMYTSDFWGHTGIATGWIEEGYMPNITGTIYFTDTTNFVDIKWRYFGGNTMPNYSVFNASNTLLDTFTVSYEAGMVQGIVTLSGTGISYLTMTSDGGYASIIGMTYDYDGLTDGRNNDTVPEPATLLLLGSGLAGILVLRKKSEL